MLGLPLEPFQRNELLLALDFLALVGEDFVEDAHQVIAPTAG